MADITAAMARLHTAVAVHVYANSGHGFNNDGAPHADREDVILERSKTLAFFAGQLDSPT